MSHFSSLLKSNHTVIMQELRRIVITCTSTNYHSLKNAVEVQVTHLGVRNVLTKYGQKMGTGMPVVRSDFY